MGEERKVCKVLVGKPEGKRPLERPRHRWEDVIRMDLREIGFGGVDWIRLVQDRDRWWTVVSAVMNLRVFAPWS
jgi:ribosome biogenesis protein Nip4